MQDVDVPKLYPPFNDDDIAIMQIINQSKLGLNPREIAKRRDLHFQRTQRLRRRLREMKHVGLVKIEPKAVMKLTKKGKALLKEVS